MSTFPSVSTDTAVLRDANREQGQWRDEYVSGTQGPLPFCITEHVRKGAGLRGLQFSCV